ncbi:hypothetical protein TL16_g07337 [Triparma laevis f. inornata]|uniref:PHD-type domain-containing protein n=1 Tax=Triparma laevis f. inornata TaxID=1714386 RepID=A0A9W7AQB1_9STRA|nr:hypothetical protein TL16_g07337 [Triparma laevis f. inornata]
MAPKPKPKARLAMKYASNDPRGGKKLKKKGEEMENSEISEILTTVYPPHIKSLEKFPPDLTIPKGLIGPSLLSLAAARVHQANKPPPNLPTITYSYVSPPANFFTVTVFYDPSVELNADDYNDDLCCFCSLSGELNLCDYCPGSFHATCHPDDICPRCVVWGRLRDDIKAGRFDVEGRKARDADSWDDLCRTCGEKGEVMLCSFCPSVMHEKCSSGGNMSAKNDDEDWVCGECTMKLEVGSSVMKYVIPDER